MGYYATKDDITDTYGVDLLTRVADHNRDKVVDEEVVEMGLQSADDMCNAYIGAYYPVPLDPVPGIVKKCAIDIAVYNMAIGRMERTEEMRVRYEDALKILTMIGQGKIAVVAPGSGGGGSGGDGSGVNQPRKGRSINTGRA